MKKYKICIVGCGELGSRHLQAVASLIDVEEVYVIDGDKNALDVGKKRLAETADKNKAIKFFWLRRYGQKIDQQAAKGDLCIVATQAKGRCQAIKEVFEQLGYRKFLIEKVVAQSIDEYKDLSAFARINNLSIWVNCKSRAYSVHKYIRSRLDPNKPILFTTIGGNDGLANNGIHTADLFVFYDRTKKIHRLDTRIDPILQPSKRGPEVFDLSGSVYGYSDKESVFMLSFASRSGAPTLISIAGSKSRFIVDHYKKFAYESYADSGWQWSCIPIEENWLVSHMTKAFATDILRADKCDLPTLEECYPAHEFIFETLAPAFKQLLKTDGVSCPVV